MFPNHFKKHTLRVVTFLLVVSSSSVINAEQSVVNVLIVDGQNNHVVWPKSTMVFKRMLEDSKRFNVDIARTKYVWKSHKFIKQFPLNDGKVYIETEPKIDETFSPQFSNYDVIISNFGWRAANWPATTQQAFEQYIANGGGFVSVHAADNSFPLWQAYNDMIGLGGWGDRNQKDGPYVYYNNDEKLVIDNTEGSAGAHGKPHEFIITMREQEHPITKGLPQQWLHTKDELYNRLRGPAKNMTILATAYDDTSYGGFGRHEPVLMTINYQMGRIFHTTLGHDSDAIASVGFITTLLRGTEWAATGKVTLPIPSDFPTKEKSSAR